MGDKAAVAAAELENAFETEIEKGGDGAADDNVPPAAGAGGGLEMVGRGIRPTGPVSGSAAGMQWSTSPEVMPRSLRRSVACQRRGTHHMDPMV